MKLSHVTIGLAGLLTAAMTGAAEARDQIRIVGSSTVFPFSTAVAENFGRISDFKTPIVESTGSGGGLKLFCAGIGVGHPDIANSSRRIKESEVKNCAGNGVAEIVEVKIGFDGIVLASSRQAPPVDLSLRDIWLALAKDVPGPDGTLIANPNRTWKDVNQSLPNARIEVLGPPPTSGTRDAFVELAMEGGAAMVPAMAEMKQADADRFAAVAHAIREDGHFVEAGENDNLIVQKLVANPAAFGVFGFSFLDQNTDVVQGSSIDGVEPTFESIASGDYPVSRSMYFYVKKAHVGVIPGIEAYVGEFTSEKAWGPDGYLADKGLIPLPEAERAKVGEMARALTPLSM